MLRRPPPRLTKATVSPEAELAYALGSSLVKHQVSKRLNKALRPTSMEKEVLPALAAEEHSQGIRPSSVAFGGDLPRPPPPTPPRDSPGDSPGRRAVKKVVSIFSSPAKVDEEV